MRHLILTLLFLISATMCGRALNRVSDHLGISDGLSNNFVTDIVQDGYGYLWIGTDNGLDRFTSLLEMRFQRSGIFPRMLQERVRQGSLGDEKFRQLTL